jgi:hypothetical protein
MCCREMASCSLYNGPSRPDLSRCLAWSVLQVGFTVITTEVDTNNLLGNFDLHPFDNFLPIDMYNAQYQEAKERVHAAKVVNLKSWLSSDNEVCTFLDMQKLCFNPRL